MVEIAHFLSTVMRTDCILILDIGRIAEMLKSSPFYAEIYKRPLRDTGNKAR